MAFIQILVFPLILLITLPIALKAPPARPERTFDGPREERTIREAFDDMYRVEEIIQDVRVALLCEQKAKATIGFCAEMDAIAKDFRALLAYDVIVLGVNKDKHAAERNAAIVKNFDHLKAKIDEFFQKELAKAKGDLVPEKAHGIEEIVNEIGGKEPADDDKYDKGVVSENLNELNANTRELWLERGKMFAQSKGKSVELGGAQKRDAMLLYELLLSVDREDKLRKWAKGKRQSASATAKAKANNVEVKFNRMEVIMLKLKLGASLASSAVVFNELWKSANFLVTSTFGRQPGCLVVACSAVSCRHGGKGGQRAAVTKRKQLNGKQRSLKN